STVRVATWCTVGSPRPRSLWRSEPCRSAWPTASDCATTCRRVRWCGGTTSTSTSPYLQCSCAASSSSRCPLLTGHPRREASTCSPTPLEEESRDISIDRALGVGRQDLRL